MTVLTLHGNVNSLAVETLQTLQGVIGDSLYANMKVIISAKQDITLDEINVLENIKATAVYSMPLTWICPILLVKKFISIMETLKMFEKISFKKFD